MDLFASPVADFTCSIDIHHNEKPDEDPDHKYLGHVEFRKKDYNRSVIFFDTTRGLFDALWFAKQHEDKEVDLDLTVFMNQLTRDVVKDMKDMAFFYPYGTSWCMFDEDNREGMKLHVCAEFNENVVIRVRGVEAIAGYLSGLFSLFGGHDYSYKSEE